jgi:hypothetical protein
MVDEKYKGETCVIVATGPSIDQNQIDVVKNIGVHCITVNNSYKLVPWSIAHISCNKNWWEYYTKEKDLIELKHSGCELWTQHREIAESFGINYIKTIHSGKNGNGLSKDRSYIHENHGSGPMAINLATHYGFKKIILIGHDLKYAKDYDGKKRNVGSTPRHFFGEYPKEMQHWASTRVVEGVMTGYKEYYRSMLPDLNELKVKVLNCTPNSALDCFEKDELGRALSE